MDRYPYLCLQPSDSCRRDFNAGEPGHHRGTAPQDSSEFRHFSFQPILGTNRQVFGIEALFHPGENRTTPDVHITSRIMVDNWLLYGFEELTDGRPIFLKCSRDLLASGFVSLLPRSVVLEIQESIYPDQELLTICRSLSALGYRFALDDFESLKSMEPFLDLVSFIRVNYRHPRRRERASILRGLRLTQGSLIAEMIECEEDYEDARTDGYELFQGAYLGESVSFQKKRDHLNPVHCTRILEDLQEPELMATDLAKMIDFEPGIECRLLRRANWVTPPNVVINTLRDALEVVEVDDVRKLVSLAMAAASAATVKSVHASSRRSLLQRDLAS